jgi:large subunit ribosomal protein L25
LDTVTLEAEPRVILGKNVRTLRAQGLIPANVYGAGRPSTPVQLDERDFVHRLLRSSRSTPVTLQLADGSRQVLIREVQRHPTSGRVLHVDFQDQA